jgi:DNA-binding transcriptional ArsR family regulator|tara:strand:- start:1710 stop:2171 length:462 start_codon:yes stop_codon:yes gene_type:complete
MRVACLARNFLRRSSFNPSVDYRPITRYLTCQLHTKAAMTPDPLSAKFAALADPTRRAILARLCEGEASVNELAEPFDMSLPAVSKHLKVLEKAGLISRSREAQWRPAKLEPMALKGVADWLEHYRRYWDASFDRLDSYLRNLQKGKDDGQRN